jgi:hypothetical protein
VGGRGAPLALFSLRQRAAPPPPAAAAAAASSRLSPLRTPPPLVRAARSPSKLVAAAAAAAAASTPPERQTGAQALAGNVAEVEALLGESERERRNLRAKYIELAAKARSSALPAWRPVGRAVQGGSKPAGCAAGALPPAPLNPPF